MTRRREVSGSAGSMSHFAAREAENWLSASPAMREENHLVCSPNPEQDYIHAQGVSPAYEFDHTDHILDQPALGQRSLVDDHERAALQMEDWFTSWSPQILESQYWTQLQFSGPSQVSQQPEALAFHGPAHFIGSQEPIADQFIRHQHVPYYTNPATPTQNFGPSRRGGRVLGMKLSEDSAKNNQEVREVGSCLRCWAMKGRCSKDDPCTQCANNNKVRKWKGCFRSFSQLGNSIIPSILANHLHLASYEEWMRVHTRPDAQIAFQLPLSFGFGKTFDGFLGCEFTSLKEESMYSYSVRPIRGEVRHLRGLPIYATYKPGELRQVGDSLKKWLRMTLRDENSMSQWRWACFPGEQDVWIRQLLKKAWEYSHKCWIEENKNSEYHQVNETLFHAWSMTILATILSFQITVPPDKLDSVIKLLKIPPGPEYTTNSSRQINKGVKCVLFDTYQKMQRKVMSQLDDIVKNSKTMNDREWGNMHCVAILLIVIINQAQLSLRANYMLAELEQQNQWEETKALLEESEAAFRTIAHSFAFAFREKKKKSQSRPSNAGHDPITSRLLDILGNIHDQYRNDVHKYRSQKLNMNTHEWFGPASRLRLFAHYFHALYSKSS